MDLLPALYSENQKDVLEQLAKAISLKVFPELPSFEQARLVRYADEQVFFNRLQKLYKNRSSKCGVYLAATLSLQNLSDRRRCIILLGINRCQRALGILHRLITQLDQPYQPAEFMKRCRDERLIEDCCIALGMLDSAESHAALLDVLQCTADPTTRADVLTGMAFERDHQDVELILRHLDLGASLKEILGGLYALFHNPPGLDTDDPRVLSKISKYLSHDHPSVRGYAIQVLKHNPKNREMIQSLQNDPNESVREFVQDAERFLAQHVSDQDF